MISTEQPTPHRTATEDVLLSALDEAQTALTMLQRRVLADTGGSDTPRGVSRRDLLEARAKLDAAERALRAFELSDLRAADAASNAATLDITAAVRQSCPVVDVSSGPAGLDLLCGGKLQVLEHEDKSRLLFICGSAIEQLNKERAARHALEASVLDLTAALQQQTLTVSKLQRDNVALRARLLAQMSSDSELLERIHSAQSDDDRLVNQGASESKLERDRVLKRCMDIAAEFERTGRGDGDAPTTHY